MTLGGFCSRDSNLPALKRVAPLKKRGLLLEGPQCLHKCRHMWALSFEHTPVFERRGEDDDRPWTVIIEDPLSSSAPACTPASLGAQSVYGRTPNGLDTERRIAGGGADLGGAEIATWNLVYSTPFDPFAWGARPPSEVREFEPQF